MSKLSGAAWCAKFRGSTSLDALEPTFRKDVKNFIAALKKAGAKVIVSQTYRPPERAYMMYWAYEIGNGHIVPNGTNIPKMKGVDIEWKHATPSQSKQAARNMLATFGMLALKTKPALKSRHTEKKAVDMTISWTGNLTIVDGKGKTVTISTTPRTGMNAELQKVGKSYGVIKFWKGLRDKPHWSTDGR
jgi:D-alanyl-D-alanine dipeptidase